MKTNLHFRIGVYPPGREDEVQFCGPHFDPCPLEVGAMHSCIEEFRGSFKRRKPTLRIGVFIVEDKPERKRRRKGAKVLA